MASSVVGPDGGLVGPDGGLVGPQEAEEDVVISLLPVSKPLSEEQVQVIAALRL